MSKREEKSCFYKWAIPGLFLFLSFLQAVNSKYLCSIKVADDWIQTLVLWYLKRPRCQLCHNHCSRRKILFWLLLCKMLSTNLKIIDYQINWAINWHVFSLLIFSSNLSIFLSSQSWSSGYGRRLMFQRSWVRIPAPYTGWTLKIVMCAWKDKNKGKRGQGWPNQKTLMTASHPWFLV